MRGGDSLAQEGAPLLFDGSLFDGSGNSGGSCGVHNGLHARMPSPKRNVAGQSSGKLYCIAALDKGRERSFEVMKGHDGERRLFAILCREGIDNSSAVAGIGQEKGAEHGFREGRGVRVSG